MNRSRLFLSIITTALICLVLSACGGGSDATPTPSLSVFDLAPLVLPVQQVVVDGTTLTFSASDSGLREKNDVLDGSFNHDRDAAELDQYGWKGGRKQIFSKANDDGTGVIFAEATLDLADSSDHAAQVIPLQISDLTSDVGKTSTDSKGTTANLVSATPFTPAGISNAKGAVAKMEVNGTTIYLTGITFARGPLVMSMSTAAYDDRDLKGETETLAKQLDTQVGMVVRG